MSARGRMAWGEQLIEEGLALAEGWPDLVQDLERAGLTDEEVGLLLRPRGVWASEVASFKTAGFPYDEIIFHLRTLKATWADIARVLLEKGLSPADMLRAVLPETEDEEGWAAVRVALLEGPLDADYREVQGVLDFFLLDRDEVVDAVPLSGSPRARAIQRSGAFE